ncbi:MAG: hypothetical protein U9N46_08285 [Euryarchaeota archaeon]|nr:hypothetical protein [Euryarchaeota archaeon]
MELYNGRRRVISITITIGIILMLIFSGPSSAVTAKLLMDGLDGTEVGETGFFYFNVTIGGNERIPIADFSIDGLPDINGSPEGRLVFGPGDVGTAVGDTATSGNYLIELVKIHGWVGGENCGYGYDDGLGYGYGYGYGYESNYDYAPYIGYGYGYPFIDYGCSYGYGYDYGYGYGYDYGYGYGYESQDSRYTELAYRITVDTTGATVGTYDAVGMVNTGASGKPHFTTSTTSFTLVGTSSPIVTNASASRDTILNDNGRPRSPGTNVAVLGVDVTDKGSGVSSVTINLTPIGGSAAQPMACVGDDRWEVTTNAVMGVNLTNQLVISATDNAGNCNDSVAIALTVLRRGDVYRDNIIGVDDAFYILDYLDDPDAVIEPPSVLVGDVVDRYGHPEGDGVVDMIDGLYLMECTIGAKDAP